MPAGNPSRDSHAIRQHYSFGITLRPRPYGRVVGCAFWLCGRKPHIRGGSRFERRDRRPGQNPLHVCIPRPAHRPPMLITPTAPPRAAEDRPESGRSDAEEIGPTVLLNSPLA